MFDHLLKVLKDERGFLSLFKKRKKPNLTPDIMPATQEQLHFTPQLRDFAEGRISGKTAGFGDDYVSRASNPVIASREARYNEIEAPAISNEFSKRGLARSAGANLATDTLVKAGQQKERDINEVVAQFFQLNELQKKKDITEGVGVGERMQNQQERMKQEQALASERLSTRTAAQQNQYQTEDRANLDKLGATLLAAASGGMSAGMGGGGFINPAGGGVGTVSGSGFNLQEALRGALGGAAGTQSNILGAYQQDPIVALLRQRGYNV